MKKLFGKKQAVSHINEKPLKQLSSVASKSFDENDALEKYHPTTKKKALSRRHIRPTMSESTDSEFLDLRYNNPNFSKHDSLSIDQGEEASTSKNCFNRASMRKEKNIAEMDNLISLNESYLHEVKINSQQNSEIRSRSEDTVEQHNKNLFLKKTEEKTNFCFNNREINLTKEDGLQYAAERLRLTDETSSDEVSIKSNVFFNENLLNEINLMEPQGDKCMRNDGKLLSCVPFQNCEENGFDELVSQERKDERKMPSKNSFFKKFRAVTFFVGEENQNGSKLTHSDANAKENKKSDKVEAKFIDAEVSIKEDLETKQYLLDFFIYLLHLIFITTIAVSMVSSNMYYFTNVTSSLFFDTKNTPSFSNITARNKSAGHSEKTLRESKIAEDFWAFAESTMVDLLYWEFYNSQTDSSSHTEKNDKKMFYENQILGVARLRQVRVKNDSCKIHSDVKKFFNSCYYYYSVFAEETKSIKQGMENTSTATAWVYSEAKSLNTSFYWGEISIYGGGGYYLDLAANKKNALEMVKELKENSWLSKATRAIFIDFNLYNANVNLFCICKIVLEFTPLGGMIPKPDFHSLKLIRYLTIFDFFVLACEIIYFLFVVYYTYKEVTTIVNQKISFFFSSWNYLDILILTLSYIYIVLSLVRYIYASQLISTLQNRYYEYTEFRLVKEIQINYNNVIAVLLFFCWIKLLMYLNFNKIMLQLRKTIARSLKDILGFLPLYLSLLLSFAFLANLLFGNQVKTAEKLFLSENAFKVQHYDTVWLSFVTLLQVFVGEFHYREIEEANGVLGPIFYVSFIFFIFFVFMNVFVAIVVHAYTSVKSQVILDPPRACEYFRRGCMFFFCCGARSREKSISKKTKKKLLFQEIERGLKKAGFSTAEIKIFFHKYNINFNNFLDESTKRKIIKDIELKRIEFSDTSEQVQIDFLRRRLTLLRDKIENLEMSLLPICDKIDILLQRF